jgi:hypothetical protein
LTINNALYLPHTHILTTDIFLTEKALIFLPSHTIILTPFIPLPPTADAPPRPPDILPATATNYPQKINKIQKNARKARQPASKAH